MEDLISKDQNAIIFTHGGTCSLIVCRLLGLPIAAARSFLFDNASITEIVDRGESVRQLIRYSDTLHLDL